MMRFPIELALAAALTGCAFSDGQPWGEVQTSLAVRFAPGPERLFDGRLATARDYRLQIDSLAVAVASVTLSSGEAEVAFDPADPPPGYALCHNGHCHADDGRLVAYAEIGGGAGAEPLIVLSGVGVEIAAGAAEVALGGCPDGGCEVLAPVRLNGLSVALGSVRVVGRVFDARNTPRIAAEGVAFDVLVAASAVPEGALTSALSARFGPSERLGLALDATLDLPATLFDDVDFADESDTAREAITRTLAVRIADDSQLMIDATRFD